MMGLVTGDALGNAIQFMSREEVRERGFVHVRRKRKNYLNRNKLSWLHTRR